MSRSNLPADYNFLSSIRFKIDVQIEGKANFYILLKHIGPEQSE